MDLASSRRRLPLEMNCEMYKFLKLPIQKKFIWGMGRDIYGMFRQKLLKKVCMKIPTKYEGIKMKCTGIFYMPI
jgi:hypothetical protein